MIDQTQWDKEALIEMGKLNVKLAQRRNIWNTASGIEIMSDLIINSKVFDKIDASNIYELGSRNFVIDILDGLGCLNKKYIKEIVRFLLALPLPDELEEEIDG